LATNLMFKIAIARASRSTADPNNRRHALSRLGQLSTDAVQRNRGRRCSAAGAADDLGPDNQIGDPGLVLDRDKYWPRWCCWISTTPTIDTAQ
jgi:hypothetical protein